MASISFAISTLTQCFPVLAASLVGFALYTKVNWCDASLGKLMKGKCDNTKRILFGALGGFILLVIMVSRGIGTGMPMGGGMGGGMPLY